MKKIVSLFYALVLTAGLSVTAKAADPIRIPVLNWSSQIVMSNVMSQIFQELGYETELVPADSVARYEALRVGEFIQLMKLGSQQWQNLSMKLWIKVV